MAHGQPASAPWMGILMQRALIRRLVWYLRRRPIKRLELQVKKHLFDQDVAAVVLALEKLQRDYQWPFQAESLLFKRNQRPLDIEQTLRLLDAMRMADGLLAHQRFYAGIAFVYAAIRKDDQHRLRVIRPWLVDVARLNQQIEQFAEIRARNRESKFKQIVSARGCLLQDFLAQSQEQDNSIVLAIGKANLSLLESTDLRRISADALFRSTSNLIRGLLVLENSDEQLLRACAQVERLQVTFAERRFRRVIVDANEDHLAALKVAHSFLIALLNGDSCNFRLAWIELMVNSPAPAVAAGADAWFQRLVN